MKVVPKILCTVMVLFPLTLRAGNIFIYDIKGEVLCWHDNQWETAKLGLKLNPSDSLKMSEYACVTLLEGSKKPYPAQFKGTRSVEEVLEQFTPTRKPLAIEAIEGVFREIVQPLRISVENYNEYQGAADRGAGNELELAAALVNNTTISPQIAFQLIDAATGLLIDEAVHEGTLLIVQVKNKTTIPLYVNLIDLSNKEMTPVLPIGENDDMRHLLIPANATVRLDRKDMRFEMYGKGTDQLILLADEEPFDLMEIIRLAGTPDKLPSASQKHVTRQAIRIF